MKCAGRSAQDVLDPDLATYFTRTQTSEESLWVIGYLSNESPGTSSVASMYLTDPEVVQDGVRFTHRIHSMS